MTSKVVDVVKGQSQRKIVECGKLVTLTFTCSECKTDQNIEDHVKQMLMDDDTLSVASTRDMLVTRYYLIRSRLLKHLLLAEDRDEEEEDPCICLSCYRKANPEDALTSTSTKITTTETKVVKETKVVEINKIFPVSDEDLTIEGYVKNMCKTYVGSGPMDRECYYRTLLDSAKKDDPIGTLYERVLLAQRKGINLKLYYIADETSNSDGDDDEEDEEEDEEDNEVEVADNQMLDDEGDDV